ncbi:MAG: cell filamentation protein Fic [Sulfurovum sp.]|nr:MAG: cell filamentation protein Fic [Sulfurovum sp.]
MALTDFDKELLASNLLEAKTLKQLYEKEKILTNAKMIALQKQPVVGCLDYAHLKDIHAYLFSDVYTWAGKDRYEAGIHADFGKGTTLFTSYDKLPQVSKHLFDALKDEKYFQRQDKKTFTQSAAVFMNGVNILHPFREGNGRVQRIFMEYVAKEAGYTLSFTSINADEMIKASVYGAKGDMSLMLDIFDKSITQDNK